MKVNRTLTLLIKVYLLVLSIFSTFRVILFLTEVGRIQNDQASTLNIIKSFIMGVRFDVVISGYILFIPALMLFIMEIIRVNNQVIRKIVFYWIFILFTIAFIISAADIPYFNQFFDRFSIGAFEWIENFQFVFLMIFQEPKYFLILIPFLILDVLFLILLKRIFKSHKEYGNQNIYFQILISILFLSIMFLGIRGRIQKKAPIKIGTAYFCDNPFLNKLGLNPVFTLMRSYLDNFDSQNSTINLIDSNTAILNVQSYLNLNNTKYNSPIAREITEDTVFTFKPNIVLIIMEAMSAAKMQRHGNTNNLTPFLDSLASNSIYFENIYTAGKHTFNGIFGTLFSFPSLYRQHNMKNIRSYNGFGSTLLKNGYTTTYITTHDSQFDNVEGFLRANGFQNIISQANYPLHEIKTTLGVPDDYMFRYAIPKINDLAKQDKPFFVTFMTASDHGPYYIPDYFHPKSDNIKNQIVEYADWSLKEFITLSSKEQWFDNTIFIFIADHGAPIDASYEIALNYFHSPLIFYAPKILSKKVYKKIGSQIDVFPTTMGILKKPYINNTLGVDLINQDRKFAIINNDDKIGILDSTFFCIMNEYGQKLELYKYKDKDKTDYFDQYREKAFEMADYAKSNMQVYQDMLLKNNMSIPDEN